MSASYVMRMSSNGQVSIPAAARERWHADRLLVVDLGDHVVLRPVSGDPIGQLRARYRRVSTDQMRALARAEDEEAEDRRQA
jgi:bifunctional DNA-binding transcriptional regulator/antitoxin component of YhaV-PrlF toxin-antitoxin module